MQGSAEIRHQAEFPPISVGLFGNPVLDGEEAVEIATLRLGGG
jgi:hypothetical protein